METIERLTFKSLTRNRSRCIQTNEITKHPKDYALAYYKREQNKSNQQRGIVAPRNKKSSQKTESRNSFFNYRPEFGYSNSERRFGYF
jgi:hypothetical protein